MCFVVDLFNLRHRLLFITHFVTCVCVWRSSLSIRGWPSFFCHVLGLLFVTSGERFGFVAKIWDPFVMWTANNSPQTPSKTSNCLQIVNYHVPAPKNKGSSRITHAFSIKYYHVERLLLCSRLFLFAWVFFRPQFTNSQPTVTNSHQILSRTVQNTSFSKNFFQIPRSDS